MLTSGMVPALFPDDEREAIIGQVTQTPIYFMIETGMINLLIFR